MKKILALIIAAIMLLSACGEGENPNTTTAEARNGIELTVLGTSGGEAEQNLNLVRDMLTRAGFVVSINMQPDFASFLTQIEAGNYDLAVTGWTTVTGNPDYAVRALFHSTGDSNRNGLNSARVDELIDLAASQTPAEFIETYTELEHELVTRNAYMFPLYRTLRTQAVNTTILRQDSVNLPRARSQFWELLDFVDPGMRETQPIITAQANGNLTSLDPIRGNDGSINQLNSNMYIRIVNMTNDDVVVSDGSLSWQFVIAEGNQDYYFVLRDDVNFAQVINETAVDTGVRVGAEDVVFSLNRARDRNSVPDHRTFSLHESMQEIAIVTDMDVLDTARDTTTGRTLREIMEEKTPSAITSLTADKTAANNAAGAYQVVRVTTHFPFPQVLNYLAHQSGSIVSEYQVTNINTFDVATFDITTDTIYGDQMNLTVGPTFDHHLWTSGPFIPLYRNDYQIFFERNPGYMPGTEWAPRVKNLDMRFIPSKDAELAAFRSGELHMMFTVPVENFDLIESDDNFHLIIVPSHAAQYMIPNFDGVLGDLNLRLAVLHSINQDDIMAFYQNRYFRAYSTLSSLIDTGNVLVADPEQVNYFLNRFWESQE